MADKIITTFETTLTFYDPMDKLPDCEEQVVFTKKGDFDICLFIKIRNFFYGKDDNYELDEIQWWAKLPEFL